MILLFHNVGSGKTITSLIAAMNMFSYGKPMFNKEDVDKTIEISSGDILYQHPLTSGPKYKANIK